MKKIIGILLALCFVLSVTAATAAASGDDDEHHNGPGDHDKPKFDHHKKFDRHEREHGWGERENQRFNDHHKKRHHHPAHWENKRVGHRVWEPNHGHWNTVYVIQKIYVAEFYDWE